MSSEQQADDYHWKTATSTMYSAHDNVCAILTAPDPKVNGNLQRTSAVIPASACLWVRPQHQRVENRH
jgi:hypothetical protein